MLFRDGRYLETEIGVRFSKEHLYVCYVYNVHITNLHEILNVF